jgi:hypothetical protein
MTLAFCKPTNHEKAKKQYPWSNSPR